MQPQNDLLNIRGPNLIKFRLPKSLFQDVNDSTKEEVKINILKSIGGSKGTARLKFDMDRQLYLR